MGDVQKLVVFLSTSIFFLGVVYLFTSGHSFTGAGVREVGDSSIPASFPLVVFVVLGLAIYILLTIMRKQESS